MLNMFCPQTAPVQEECNGPIQSPKPQETSTNHTGSGNMALPLHRKKTRSPIRCHFLSPLTCVAIPCPQTSASCHLSGGPFRDSSPPRLHRARLKFRYGAKTGLTPTHHSDPECSTERCIRDLLSSVQWQLRQRRPSNMAAWATLTNVKGGAWHDANIEELTCFFGFFLRAIKPLGGISSSSGWLFNVTDPPSVCLSVSHSGFAQDMTPTPLTDTMSPEEVLCTSDNEIIKPLRSIIQNSEHSQSIWLPYDWLLQIKAWEEAELDKPIDMEQIRIDPSPFQLVERTSLHKVSTATPQWYITTCKDHVYTLIHP